MTEHPACCPNCERWRRRGAAKLKAMGLQPGSPALLLVAPAADETEFLKHVVVVVDRAMRLAVIDQNGIGEKAAERSFELMMMRVDEAGHDDHTG
jgi:hypothetical protein